MRFPSLAIASLSLTGLCALSGCAGSDAEQTPPSSAQQSSSPTPEQLPLEGTTIALDPGHNGGNSEHLDEIATLVPDGRGGKKACNTTGTATRSDYPEHTFNWDVAKRTRGILEDMGARVVMSRKDDRGVGPCVDERGRFASEEGADALVSIHANSSEDSAAHGYGLVIAPGEHSADSTRLAKAIAGAMDDEEFDSNPSYGGDSIHERTDLAGLNNAEVPAALIECGEMWNAEEAEIMESEDGRRRYAQAVAAGIAHYFEEAR